MSRCVLKYYNRPKDLSQDEKKKIKELFNENEVTVDFEGEALKVWDGDDGLAARIPMEALGKMIGLMNNAGVTVRKK